MVKTIELPKYQELTDQELMEWSPKEFADKIIKKSELFGELFFHKDGWQLVELDSDTRTKGLREFSIRMAWREFYNGVQPPSKQMVMLESNQEDLGIRIRLAQQIIDEVEHQRIWSRWTKYFGGNPRIQDYEVSPEVLKQYQLANDNKDPAEIATSQQCTSEVIVPYIFGYGTLKPSENIISELLPDVLKKSIKKDVVDDEPRHINVGRDILIKYCGGAKKRRHLLNIQVTKLKNTIIILEKDLQLLGAERKTPFPIVG